MRAVAICLALMCALSCRSSGQLDPRLYAQGRHHTVSAPCSDCGDEVHVTFLGVGGFLIEWAGAAVLTAPLFTNPSLDDVLGDRPISPEGSLIEKGLPKAWVENVSAILVGHSHYDHLMDVPWIVNHLTPPGARVYGTRTMKNLIASTLLPGRATVVTLTETIDYRMCPGLEPCHGANTGQPGQPVRVWQDEDHKREILLRALCSEHSPQFLRFPPTWQGCVDEPRETPPSRAGEWKLGDTLAYLIDLVESGEVRYRIYFQDSPTQPTRGFVPPELLADGAPVDLALLCGGAFHEVDDNPAAVLENLGIPRHILVGHWEDFFQPQWRAAESEDPATRSLPLHDFTDMVDELRQVTGKEPWEGQYWFPSPGTRFVFRTMDPARPGSPKRP